MHTLKKYFSKFVRLGNRQYIQGATLIDGCLDAAENWHLGKIRTMKCEFRDLLNEQGVYYLLDSPSKEFSKSFSAMFVVVTDKGSYQIGLNGNSDGNVPKEEYDEEGLVNTAILDELQKTISIFWCESQSYSRMVVALFKKMLNIMYADDHYSDWRFFQSDTDYVSLLAIESGQLEITLKAYIGNQSAKGQISIDGKRVGTIFFTRILK